jgi:putative transcriptional regulator
MSFAGSFLIARTLLQDPNFKRTVVFLLAHNDEGAFGLVVNRPAEAEELPWPLFVGGPCPSPGLLMLHGHPEWAGEEESDDPESSRSNEVAPGIYSGDAASLDRATLAGEGELRFRVFTGYAGWGSGQLEGELAAGAWSLVPATGDVLFETPVEELWDRLLPPQLPQPSIN